MDAAAATAAAAAACANIGLPAQEGAPTRIDSHNFPNLSLQWWYNRPLTTGTAPPLLSGDSQQHFSLGHSDDIDEATGSFKRRPPPPATRGRKQPSTWNIVLGWRLHVAAFHTDWPHYLFLICFLLIILLRMFHFEALCECFSQDKRGQMKIFFLNQNKTK